MKTNIEGEPRRLADNEDPIYKIKTKQRLSGMMGYSSHRNRKPKVHEDKKYMTATPDEWFHNREMVTGTKEDPLGWYRKFVGKAPIPMKR